MGMFRLAEAVDRTGAVGFSTGFNVGVLLCAASAAGSASLTASSATLLSAGLTPSDLGVVAPFLNELDVDDRLASGVGVEAFEGGARICEEMMAGSMGAPLTLDCAVGALLAGGVYLISRPEGRDGKSWRRTPLYL
jgi:hypothetical protein